MTAFRYTAIDNHGTESHGILEADTSRAARALLRERGLFPLDISNVSPAGRHASTSRQKLRESELVLVSRQWATLLSSGLTVEKSLAALTEQAEQETSRQILASIRSDVLAGHSLRAALDRHPATFPTIYRASVAAGEKSGELAEVMLQLSDYLEERNSLRQKTQQALLYPAIVAIVATLVVIGLMTYVVPQVISVFQHNQQALPLLTRIMIGCSDFLRNWGWLLLLAIGGAGLALHLALRQHPFRKAWDSALLKLPLLGRHLKTLDATRFASTLSILAGSGVPLLSALDAGRQVMARIPLQDAVAHASERVREGQSLAKALGDSRAFPPLLIHMIANGEATGKLDALLQKAARLQQRELENRTVTLTSLLEPLLLLVMGGLVLLIVLAVMQPIIEINTLLR